MFVYVEDVDRTVDRAIAGGAQVLIPAQNQFWGDRTALIMDPSGHVWTIATRIEETSEQERKDRWSSMLSDQDRADRWWLFGLCSGLVGAGQGSSRHFPIGSSRVVCPMRGNRAGRRADFGV